MTAVDTKHKEEGKRHYNFARNTAFISGGLVGLGALATLSTRTKPYAGTVAFAGVSGLLTALAGWQIGKLVADPEKAGQKNDPPPKPDKPKDPADKPKDTSEAPDTSERTPDEPASKRPKPEPPAAQEPPTPVDVPAGPPPQLASQAVDAALGTVIAARGPASSGTVGPPPPRPPALPPQMAPALPPPVYPPMYPPYMYPSLGDQLVHEGAGLVDAVLGPEVGPEYYGVPWDQIPWGNPWQVPAQQPPPGY